MTEDQLKLVEDFIARHYEYFGDNIRDDYAKGVADAVAGLLESWRDSDRNLQDAAMLIRRCCIRLDHSLPLYSQALDWLRRKGLEGSPLRNEP